MKRYLPLILILLGLVPMIFAPSCANTTQAPSGGKKDTIPPYITMITPLPGAVNVPCENAAIVFDFNEYVTIKTAQNIFLSPPQAKMPKSKIRNKSLVVSFEEPLMPNTTYTLNISDAVADNNEGNMFPGFTYAFSTGDTIDSLYITGTVQDGSTLEPLKNATVLLYKNHADSAVFLERPYAAVKTDAWGFFSLPYIQDTLYRLYAIEDKSNNNIYDPDEDRIAFVDSLIRPVKVVNDTVAELLKYDMLDTISCLKRISEYELNVFREKPSRQYIKNFKRLGERSAFISFNAEYAWIDSLWFRGYPETAVISQFNLLQDSLELWLNDRRTGPDTLKLMVNYRKTDSLGRLEPFLEEVKLYEEGKGRRAYAKRKRADELTRKDTTCAFSIKATPEYIEENGFVLEFEQPAVRACFDSLKVKSISPRQEDTPLKFRVVSDTVNLRRFNIYPEVKYLPGYEYELKAPSRAFMDITGFYSDSLVVKCGLPTDETLSTLTLVLSDVTGSYIIDLLDEGGKNTIRTRVITEDGPCVFPYLKENNYKVRIIEDKNGNSIVDTGNILEHRQCEKVRLLKFGEEKFIKIPASSSIEQSVNLKELFAK